MKTQHLILIVVIALLCIGEGFGLAMKQLYPSTTYQDTEFQEQLYEIGLESNTLIARYRTGLETQSLPILEDYSAKIQVFADWAEQKVSPYYLSRNASMVREALHPLLQDYRDHGVLVGNLVHYIRTGDEQGILQTRDQLNMTLWRMNRDYQFCSALMEMAWGNETGSM
jgi:hypothetical protein